MQVMMSFLQLETNLSMHSMISLKVLHKVKEDISFILASLGTLFILIVLPPTEANLLYHILRAYLQIILRKAAGQTSPPNVIYSTLWLGIERWYP